MDDLALVMSPLMFAVFSPNISLLSCVFKKKSQSKIWSIFPDSQCTRVDTGYDVTSQISRSIHKHKHTLFKLQDGGVNYENNG